MGGKANDISANLHNKVTKGMGLGGISGRVVDWTGLREYSCRREDTQGPPRARGDRGPCRRSVGKEFSPYYYLHKKLTSSAGKQIVYHVIQVRILPSPSSPLPSPIPLTLHNRTQTTPTTPPTSPQWTPPPPTSAPQLQPSTPPSKRSARNSPPSTRRSAQPTS